MICNLLADMLEEWGFSVFIAIDSEQAVEMYKQSSNEGKPFDVVIMDLTVPGGIGGNEAISELLKFNPKVKCIISSGYANNPVIVNFRHYGFKGIIIKPYSQEKLLRILNQVLSE